jgi:hypothetical protein
MPTENPKISAYVPQAVYDRFKQYQEESGLSMSQAAINIFAQFLGVEVEVSGDVTKIGGVTPGRFQDLIQEVQDLTQEVQNLKVQLEEVLSKVDYLNSTNKPQDDTVEHEENKSELPKPIDKPIEVEPISEEKEIEVVHKDQPENDTDRPQLILQGELLNELPFLSGRDLALRLNVSTSKLTVTKSEKLLDDFIDWSKEKDPDQVGWSYKPKAKGRGVDYLPSSELSDELKSKLLRWIKGNTSQL